MVRTGQVQNNGMTEAQYVQQICGEMSGLLSSSNCTSTLQVDMQSFSGFSQANYNNVVNRNGSLNSTQMQYAAGGPCDVVLVRAFYPWSIMTPFLAPLLETCRTASCLSHRGCSFPQ